jgi:hypothetical protein
MSPDEIKHFLVVYDSATGQADVRDLGTDYDAAQDAYSEAEREHAADDRFDVVLLSADSLATVKETHSSYFRGSGKLKLPSSEGSVPS